APREDAALDRSERAVTAATPLGVAPVQSGQLLDLLNEPRATTEPAGDLLLRGALLLHRGHPAPDPAQAFVPPPPPPSPPPQPLHHARRPGSAITAWAAFRPFPPITEPPGCVAAPHRYSPGTAVRGRKRRSHIWSGRHSPWKMWPPVRPMRASTSGGPRTSRS